MVINLKKYENFNKRKPDENSENKKLHLALLFLFRRLLHFYSTVKFIKSKSDEDSYNNTYSVDQSCSRGCKSRKRNDHDCSGNDNTDDSVKGDGIVIVK